MCDHFELMIRTIRHDVEQFKSTTGSPTPKYTDIKLMQKMADAVKLHVKIVECVK